MPPAAARLKPSSSSLSGALATGTGTDTTVVVRGSGPARRYGGTHTRIGAMIGRAVHRAVAAGLGRSTAETAKNRHL